MKRWRKDYTEISASRAKPSGARRSSANGVSKSSITTVITLAKNCLYPARVVGRVPGLGADRARMKAGFRSCAGRCRRNFQGVRKRIAIGDAGMVRRQSGAGDRDAESGAGKLLAKTPGDWAT